MGEKSKIWILQKLTRELFAVWFLLRFPPVSSRNGPSIFKRAPTIFLVLSALAMAEGPILSAFWHNKAAFVDDSRHPQILATFEIMLCRVVSANENSALTLG